jgi:hypothetical protein
MLIVFLLLTTGWELSTFVNSPSNVLAARFYRNRGRHRGFFGGKCIFPHMSLRCLGGKVVKYVNGT